MARRFESVCESALLNITSQVGLATIEYAAIASLDDAPDLTADELAVRMGMKPALASSILDRITTRGLVSQQSGEEGRYRLSEDGYEVRQRLKPAVIDAIDRIVSPLSDIERSTLHDMLARIIQANEDTIIDAQR
ncbi:MarR family winged helix-turn-helix transcriptional regulator [Methylobacterium sp. P31]